MAECERLYLEHVLSGYPIVAIRPSTPDFVVAKDAYGEPYGPMVTSVKSGRPCETRQPANCELKDHFGLQICRMIHGACTGLRVEPVLPGNTDQADWTRFEAEYIPEDEELIFDSRMSVATALSELPLVYRTVLGNWEKAAFSTLYPRAEHDVQQLIAALGGGFDVPQENVASTSLFTRAEPGGLRIGTFLVYTLPTERLNPATAKMLICTLDGIYDVDVQRVLSSAPVKISASGRLLILLNIHCMCLTNHKTGRAGWCNRRAAVSVLQERDASSTSFEDHASSTRRVLPQNVVERIIEYASSTHRVCTANGFSMPHPASVLHINRQRCFHTTLTATHYKIH